MGNQGSGIIQNTEVMHSVIETHQLIIMMRFHTNFSNYLAQFQFDWRMNGYIHNEKFDETSSVYFDHMDGSVKH